MAKGKPVTSFYIMVDDIHVEFDATLTASVSESASISEHPLQSGAKVADHVTRENTTITLTGIINSIKSTAFNSKESPDTVRQAIDLLRGYRKDGTKLSVVVTQDFPIFESCIISDLIFEQNENRNTVSIIDSSGQRVVTDSAWDVTISFTNFEEATLPTSTIITIPNPDFNTKGKTGNSSDSDYGTGDKEPSRTLLFGDFESITSLFSGLFGGAG